MDRPQQSDATNFYQVSRVPVPAGSLPPWTLDGWYPLATPKLLPGWYRLTLHWQAAGGVALGTTSCCRLLLRFRWGDAWHCVTWLQHGDGTIPQQGILLWPTMPVPVDFFGTDVQLMVQDGPVSVAGLPLQYDIQFAHLGGAVRPCCVTDCVTVEPLQLIPAPVGGGYPLNPLTKSLTLAVELAAADLGRIDLWVLEYQVGAAGPANWRRLSHPYGPPGNRSWGNWITESDTITIPIQPRTYYSVTYTCRGFAGPAFPGTIRIYQNIEVP
jgi:hypothetical protein